MKYAMVLSIDKRKPYLKVSDQVRHKPGSVTTCDWRLQFLAHLSRRLVDELIVYPWSGVRPSSSVVVRRPSSSTISNMNISATSGPIATKFYLKHHWVGGKATLGFGPDWIRTLVSMATESSHRVIMEKTVSFSYLQAMMTCMRARTSSNFRLIGSPTVELAALERLKKIPIGL